MLTSTFKGFTVFLFFYFSCQLNAQTYFGLRAGANFANASKKAEDTGDTDGRIIGPNIGTYFDFGLNKSLSLQPEINFLQTGYKKYYDKTYKFRFNYFDFAFLLKIKRQIKLNEKGAKMNIYGNFGPYIGYAFRATSSGEVRDLGGDNQDDLGLLASVGAAFPSGRNGLFVVDLRYVFGLARIEGFGDYRNRGILPSIGYAWKI